MLRLIMDSLRYWVEEMHVDGFRFDLAPAHRAQRPAATSTTAAPFLVGRRAGPGAAAGQADRRALGPRRPRLPGRRLPARLERMERPYRDRVRDFWRGAEGSLPRVRRARCAARPTSTGRRGRGPRASVNLVTVHDGFTLHDLVSYNDKHNEANARGQPRRREPQPQLELRRRRRRPTTPTILALARAPEAQLPRPRCSPRAACRCCWAATRSSRTQGGNNNAYCQDNPVSWFDWSEARRSDPLLRLHARR